ncbi:hypothetical protein ACA097_27815 [Pseudomonas sp. QL9]|uniref:hypothetical protein n=1 Tax=Pseudomonas sp. QL9 TaxID=3242725 RepID=UPI00352B107B
MKRMKGNLFVLPASIFALVSLSACADSIGGRVVSWKEQALLHDGSVMEVSRTVRIGGHNVMYPSNYTEQSITFTLPETGKEITWEEPFKSDMGGTSLQPITVEVEKETAYIVSSPINCITYSYWGMPNPPYIIYAYRGDQWGQIALADLPEYVKRPNIIVSGPATTKERMGVSLFTVEQVDSLNKSLSYPQLNSILRGPVGPESMITSCLKYTRHGTAWETRNPNNKFGQ